MKRYHISYKTWFFAAVEAEASVLWSVVMVTANTVQSTTIGALESDRCVEIVHILYV